MAIEDVRLLVAERQRYDDWLAALEARRAETPSRVFERVYGDYVGRRSSVLDQLREHIESLTTLGQDLEARINSLEEQLAAHEDERAEASLRTAVGEYDGDRWESVRQDVEAKISTLSEQRGGLMSEVDDVRTLLASARPEPVEPAPEESVAAQTDEHTHVEAELVAIAHAPVAHELAEQVVAEHAVTDHMIAATLEPTLELVPPALPTPIHVPAAHSADVVFFGEPVAAPTSAAHVDHAKLHEIALAADAATVSAAAPGVDASRAPQPHVADEHDGEDFDDALALFSTEPRVAPASRDELRTHAFERGTPTTAESLQREHSVPPAANSSDARFGVGVAPQPVSADPSPARDAFDDLAFLRSVIDPAAQSTGSRSSTSTDQQKTLRCTECGTMNFPTEWYCERCGGELAAF